MKKHQYETHMVWTGNLGEGTSTYRSYSRNFTLTAPSKPQLLGSSDHAFRGDADRYNPEDMLVAALSSCHMLSYLHVCAMNNIVVLAYEDRASGHAGGPRRDRGHGQEPGSAHRHRGSRRA